MTLTTLSFMPHSAAKETPAAVVFLMTNHFSVGHRHYILVIQVSTKQSRFLTCLIIENSVEAKTMNLVAMFDLRKHSR